MLRQSGMEFNIRAQKGGLSYTHTGIDLFAYQSDGKTAHYAEPLVMKQADINDPINHFLRINKPEAQKLMDDLWDCGLRPSEGSGSAGSLRKTEEHLKDMRKIVFTKLSIKDLL